MRVPEWRNQRSVSAQVFDPRNKNKRKKKEDWSDTHDLGQFVGEME